MNFASIYHSSRIVNSMQVKAIVLTSNSYFAFERFCDNLQEGKLKHIQLSLKKEANHQFNNLLSNKLILE